MDVESLFTNVPVTETISIITNIIFKDTDVFNGFNKKQFTKLLCLAVQDNVFMFIKKLFKQVDGVALGSPLGPFFTNFFLGFLEQKYFTECNNVKPTFYVRYVDDTFVLFNDRSHIEQFVVYLNTWHKNLKFTYEIENNLMISFIGISVLKTYTGFMSSIHYKQTHTGLYTNICSNLPDTCKKGTFTGLLLRIYSCNITNAKQKHGHVVSLPFYGAFMLKYRNSLRKIVKQYFPEVNVSFVFTVPCRFNRFFNVKDVPPVDILSNIIYKFQCSSCNAIYVGKTS